MQLSLAILIYGAAISAPFPNYYTSSANYYTSRVKKITILAVQMQLPSQIVGGCSFGSSQIGWPSRGAV